MNSLAAIARQKDVYYNNPSERRAMMIEKADLRSRSGPTQSYLENGSGSSGLAKMSSSEGVGGRADEGADCDGAG